ncbi:hypothetical protein ABIB90_006244 [Bradyrhizobium sp. JR4.1]|uniref:hypothetical protein n=1 Tax=unclassified Bradyrhizobium TaxID=2631580 RepID=UPI00048353CD|nr:MULTISPECIES: hypothetical protein [unclassified Bradyrhizobium]MDH2351161.1 hypothetical protein [Bradyrhizobium sp. SSUT112]
MNMQVTVLKILVSYPEGFAVMADLKRDMAILATSGPEWAERTKRLGARVPGLDIFSDGLIERQKGGWRITVKGRAVLESMEARRSEHHAFEKASMETAGPPVPALPQPMEPGKLRRERRQHRREARERARAHAS